jgi:methylmalonyl-CoA mutase C-terminal domain/subunit
MELFPRVVEELKKRGMADVVLFGGGIIPRDDLPALEKMGFRGVFGPGASTLDIVEWVRKNVPAKGAPSKS